MLDITWTDGRAARMLDGMEDRLERTRPLMGLMLDELHDYEEEVFDTEGFGQWEALSPATLAAKNGGRNLVDNGALRASLTGGGSGSIEKTDVDSVAVGTTHPGAAHLKRGARGMPSRDPAPEPPSRSVRTWANKALHYVTTGRH